MFLKKYFTLALLVYFGTQTLAQTDSQSQNNISIIEAEEALDKISMEEFNSGLWKKLQSCERYPFKGIYSSKDWDYPESSIIIMNNSDFQKSIKNNLLQTQIDFNKEVILYSTFGGDCHISIKNHLFLDAHENKLYWIAFNIYGGCRGAGLRNEWLQLPKPEGTVELIIQEVLVDYIEDYENSELFQVLGRDD